MSNSTKAVNKFMNNNNFVLSIISQYVGAKHLKNIFTNKVLKEYKEIINQYGAYSYLSPLNYNKIKSKYFNIIKSIYILFIYIDNDGNNGYDGYYQEHYTHKNILYSKLGYFYFQRYEYNPYHNNYRVINDDDIPPSIIIQLNYFD